MTVPTPLAVVNMDYITFVEMCFRHGVLRSTYVRSACWPLEAVFSPHAAPRVSLRANAEAILDIETRAAIFIQRQFRRHMDALKQRRRRCAVTR